MTSKAFYIYGLKASNSDRIMYVGKAENPSLRFFQHLRMNKDGDTKKDEWITGVHAEGHQVEMVIIDSCEDNSMAYEIESFWINYFRNVNPELTNAIILAPLPNTTARREYRIEDCAIITERVAQDDGKQRYVELSLTHPADNKPKQARRNQRRIDAMKRIGYDTLDTFAAAALALSPEDAERVKAILRKS